MLPFPFFQASCRPCLVEVSRTMKRMQQEVAAMNAGYPKIEEKYPKKL
jgi:hypothetical protein